MRQWTPVDKHPNIFSYELKKGQRFGIRRKFTNSDGGYEEFTRSGFKSWRDADAVLKKFENDYTNGSIAALTGSKVRLGDYFDSMVSRKFKYGAWRQSTVDTFTRNFNNHIRPRFGSTRMSDIKRAPYQAMLDSMVDHGATQSFVRSIHRCMMTTINSAVTEDVLDKNRLRGIEIHGEKPKSVTIEPADYDKWMNAAMIILSRYDLAMIMVLALGLRKGELMGLRTNSISFETRNGKELAAIKIDMQRNADYLNGGPLKNRPSYRTIWVDGEIVDYLHYAITYSDNMRQQNGIHPDGTVGKPWLWVARTGNGASYTYLDYKIKDVNDATGLKFRPHMLRHYFATNATLQGAPQSEVMHWLGHKNLQMTHDYTRPTEPGMLDVFDFVKNEKNAVQKNVPQNVPQSGRNQSETN